MKKYLKIIFFSSLILVLGCESVSAAKIFITENQKVGLVSIDVMLDPEDENINALSGTLSFDSSVLANPSIHTEDSIINNWIIIPSVDQLHATNIQTISWSGIIPSGFVGVRNASYEKPLPGKILKVVFTPIVSKQTSISIKDIDLKSNDGLGTTIPTKDANLSFNIEYPSANIDSINSVNSKNIHVLIGRDQNIFNNKYFIAFENAIDSGVIDHYEMTESPLSSLTLLTNPDWRRVTSPALLEDQDRKSYIYLRAIGHNGRMAYVILNPSNTDSNNKIIFSYVIIIIIILLVCLILFKINSIRNKINNQ